MTRDLAEVEIKLGISLKEIIAAIKGLNEEDKEFLIENLLAATSQDYLNSIKEARDEYRSGELIPHDKLFEDSR